MRDNGSFSESEIEGHRKHYEIKLRMSGYDEATISKVTRSTKLNGYILAWHDAKAA